MVKTHKRPFRFGAMVRQDYEDLALLLPNLEDLLNNDIDLAEYTDLVEKIYFVPMILSAENDAHEEESQYDEAERKIFLRVKFDPEDLAGLEKEAFLHQISLSFITELKRLEVLPKSLIDDLHKLLLPEDDYKDSSERS